MTPVAALGAVLLLLLGCAGAQPLSADFYKTSCPDVAAIIKQAAAARFQQDSFAPPAVLRLISHDALVGNGVDGSVLITGSNSEQAASDNLDLSSNGFDAITAIKAAVEARCPRTVSCADVLAQASRDLVVLVGGPSWAVRYGRRDSLSSSAANVKLPGGDAELAEILPIFAKLGLSTADVVALSGAHTIGFAHCHSFVKRLYSFNATVKLDPSLDPSLAQALEDTCPQNGVDTGSVVPLDPNSVERFDRIYYKNLKAGQGVMHSDQILASDARTKGLVTRFSKSTPSFFQAFGDAMVKMSEANVLTGTQGEVRLDCTKFNSGVKAPPPVKTPPAPKPKTPPAPKPKTPPAPKPKTPPAQKPKSKKKHHKKKKKTTSKKKTSSKKA